MTWTSTTILGVIAKLPVIEVGMAILHSDLVNACELTTKQVCTACTTLEKHGYLLRQKYADGSVKPGHYQLTELGVNAIAGGMKSMRLTSGPKAPHGTPRSNAGTLRERVWRLLRIKDGATAMSVTDLLSTLIDADGNVNINGAKNNVQKYLQQLKRAGYLAEVRRAAPTSLTSNGEKRYLLIRNTGPLAPILKVSKSLVFDQNQQVNYDIHQ